MKGPILKFENIYTAQVHSQCVGSTSVPVNLYVGLVVQIRLFYCVGYFVNTSARRTIFSVQSFVYLQSVMVILSGCGIE